MIKKFNDTLALVLFGGILAIWISQGLGIINLEGTEITGATIAIATLVAQFYFRKAQNGS